MALTAKFVADFSSFEAAVAKAEVSLKSFEGNANKVGSSLNRMVDNFSGRKLIQEATLMATAVEKIGGPAKLTATELQHVSSRASEAAAKMKALGIDVPPKIKALADQVQPLPSAFSKVSGVVTALGGALGLVFTGTAILNGIKNQITAALDYADSLAKLKAKTELSYRDLQILEDVGISTGVSIEALSSAVQILQMRLGDGTARKGIQALGLEFYALKQLGPAEQLTQIGAAIARIEDPTERAKVAAQVFGRTWKEILPALKANMADAAKSAKIVGDSQIDAADRAGDRWDKFWSDQKRGWVAWAGNIILNWEKVSNKKTELDRKMAGGLPTLPTGPSARIGGGATVNDVIDPTMISQLRVYGKTLDETTVALDKTTSATKRGTEARDKFLEMSKAALGAEFDWQRELDFTKFKLDKLTVSETQLYDVVGDLTAFIQSHKGEMFPELPQGSLDAWKQAQTTITDTRPRVDALDDSLSKLTRGFEQLAQIGGDTFGGIAKEIGELIASIKLATDAGKGMNDAWQQIKPGGTAVGFQATSEGYANLALNALAAASAINAATNSTSKAKNIMSGAATGAAAGNKVMPGGTGAIVGAVVGASVGWYKSNTREGKQVSPLRDKFFDMAGGLEKLNPEVLRATGSLKLIQDVFKAKTVQDYTDAVRALTGTMAAWDAKVADVWDGMGELEARMLHVTEISPELAAALQSAYDSTNPDDYLAAIAEINGILDEQAAKQKFLEETMEKYGLAWTDLGEAARKAHVAETSADIEKEFRALLGAGVDVNNIMRHMGDSVSDFVLEAKKSGTEVPESFRDVIQTAIDAGEMFSISTGELEKLKEEAEKLGKPFDDTKYKITDIKDAGIVFGTTMETATKGVQTAIEKLITVIETKLGPAIQNIPDTEVEIRGRFIPPKDMPDNFDFPAIEMARGGRGMVKKPTLFLAGEAGPEEFAFSGSGKKFGGRGDSNVINLAEFKEFKAELAGLRADMDRDRRRQPHQTVALMKSAIAQGLA